MGCKSKKKGKAKAVVDVKKKGAKGGKGKK